MSPYVIRLPDIGEGIAEAEIVSWHVAVGDSVVENEAVVEVMTDKATVELPSPVTGTVTWLAGEAGAVLAVGSALVRLDVDGGASAAPTTEATVAPAPVARPPAVRPPAPPSETPLGAPAPTPPSPGVAFEPSRALAAPAVRRRAADLGVDLSTVTGTGPDGRVEHRDLDELMIRARRSGAAADARAAADDVESVPLVGLRRNIAQRMQRAKEHIPHFTYVEEVDVTEIERLRAELHGEADAGRHKLSVLPFVMRAIVLAVRDHPRMNARFDDEENVIHRHSAVHLGIAVQTPAGLMVPVVHHAEGLDLWGCSDEVTRLSTGARAATLSLEELRGSTITLTSLGRLGGVVSTPIINHPEVAIVGVNKVTPRPVYRDGVLAARQMMNLSSSFDHRVIDGSDAAEFVQRLRALLETPARLFMTD